LHAFVDKNCLEKIFIILFCVAIWGGV
jgi:hypothetical protein